MISKRQKAILHVAKAKLGMDDETYRLVLLKVAGVTTSNDLTQDGFEAVMGFFDHCGFKPTVAAGASYGNRSGFASPAQVELIRSLWMEVHREHDLDEGALNGWLRMFFKVSPLRFLPAATAPKVITALKVWKSRAA